MPVGSHALCDSKKRSAGDCNGSQEKATPQRQQKINPHPQRQQNSNNSKNINALTMHYASVVSGTVTCHCVLRHGLFLCGRRGLWMLWPLMTRTYWSSEPVARPAGSELKARTIGVMHLGSTDSWGNQYRPLAKEFLMMEIPKSPSKSERFCCALERRSVQAAFLRGQHRRSIHRLMSHGS